MRNGKIIYCEYFMHEDCPETCDYALDIKGKNNKKSSIGINDGEIPLKKLDNINKK